MDQDNDWLEDDLLSALYKALDTLEELDPKVRKEDWFQYLERAVDRYLANQTKDTYH